MKTEPTPTKAGERTQEWKPVKETSRDFAGVIDDTGLRVADVYGESLFEREKRSILFANSPKLLETLQMMIRAFNVEEIDPFVAFATIEKARAVVREVA